MEWRRAEGDGRAAGHGGWRVVPNGVLDRRGIGAIVRQLGDLPPEARALLIDWRLTVHVDFRALSALVAVVRMLRDRGIWVRSTGIDPYLRTVLRFSLPEDEFELLAGHAESAVRLSAEERGGAAGMYAIDFVASGISRN